jgi:YrbI family 3-deoxy-D-manno-octulosonate 8-phosphate phosphatase
MNFDLSLFHTLIFDFDGVFTDNYLFVDENGIESIRVSRADGYAVNLLSKTINTGKISLDVFILSTETNRVVQSRAKKLGLECISGAANKLVLLEDKFSIERPRDPDPFSGLIYFGNDLNDLPVILKAGLSFAPSDAHPMIKKSSTKVLSQPGGHNFVREGVEFLLGIEALDVGELSESISNC